ncbi:hypothetical protein E2C01_021878 [Portunus trituberculatus]|uniref:Uncharacterized protein n=1 Tax=Portunus trituberculatus TaxID=210409 RepID=A0A5B7E5R7_PORTR|nr:hypothetical protein [Portunus trituberculatus]
MVLESVRALVFLSPERVSWFLSVAQSFLKVSMEVAPRSSGFPGETGPGQKGALSVPSVVLEKTLEGSFGPTLVAGSFLTVVCGRPLKGHFTFTLGDSPASLLKESFCGGLLDLWPFWSDSLLWLAYKPGELEEGGAATHPKFRTQILSGRREEINLFTPGNKKRLLEPYSGLVDVGRYLTQR